jgi:hypothetical protein
MTASELKAQVEANGHEPHFFTRNTMRFFGDRMANYGVREATIDTYTEKGVKVWELYRRHAVKHGLKNSAYFDAITYERRFETKP